MEKKLQEIREKCYQMLLHNPAMKGKTPQELEAIARTLVSFAQLLYTSITEKGGNPA